MEEVTEALRKVFDVANMSQTEALIKLGLLLLLGVFYFALSRKMKNAKIEASRRQEDREHQQNTQDLGRQNRTENDQVQTDSQASDDFFNGGSR